MKKTKSLIACLFSILTLTGCSNNFSDGIQIGDIGDKKPASMKEIKFDGAFVQTNSATWAIAFESYSIGDKSIDINGSFHIPSEINFGNIIELETELNANKENSPYIISHSESLESVNDVVYSNLKNTKWNLNEIDRNNLCYFALSIDISPLLESNKLLGELILNSYFNVFHDFNGETI